MRAKEIDIAKFILILGVIMIHSNIYSDGGEGFSRGGMLLMNLLPRAICSVCVPSFFILSGFLYFKNVNQFSLKLYAEKSKRRIHTLLIPYLICNVIDLIILLFKSTLLSYPSFGIITNHGIDIFRIFEGFWAIQDGYPFAFAFWFIRNLIIISLLSPIAYLLAKRLALFVLTLLLICIFDISLYGFEFFMIGAFVAIHLHEIRLHKKWVAILCGALWICLSLLWALTDYWCETLRAISSVAACYSILYVSSNMNLSSNRFVQTLLKSTFCLYAFHQFYCSIIRHFYEGVFGVNTFLGVAAAFLSSWLTLIALSFIIWMLLDKIAPRFIAILSGNRSNLLQKQPQ